MLKRTLAVALLILSAACAGIARPPVVTPPQPMPPVVVVPSLTEAQALDLITAAYRDLLDRVPDPFGIADYTARLQGRHPEGRLDDAGMRAHIKASPEWKAKHPCGDVRCPAPLLIVRGRQFYEVDSAFLTVEKLYVPRWVSGLTLLVKTPEEQDAFLDWAAKTGFNGVHVFAGALTWAGQTPEGARAALPALLDKAAARGLTVEVTAITDSATGYDAREHVRLLAGLLTNRRGVVFELANEVGHHTQAANITAENLRAWGRELVPAGLPWAVGAASVDEPGEDGYPTSGGSYSTAHLDRGRDFWNQLRRVREIYSIVESSNPQAPAINNEPIGCAEPGTPGQRLNDPAAFFTLGALERAFSVGGVHHSQAGLMAELPGPVQQQCAAAYVAAHAAVESALPGIAGQYKNVTHEGSPLLSARLVEPNAGDGAVRAYSFISGDRGVTVLVGVKGDAGLQWGNGWRPVREVARMTAADGRACVVLEIGR